MSSRKYDDVLVFGPTGTVGGITALEASKRGAKVWLAMRDPTKAIPELPADVEKSGSFSRVQADLTDPASVTKAVQASGAKAAYIYLIHGADMRPTLQALRDAGVEHVVFLSGAIVTGDVALRDIPKTNYLVWAHAQVEIALEDLGFPYVTALRAGTFASNFRKQWVDTAVTPPRIRIIRTDVLIDNITGEDIGAVGGAVLVERPSDGNEVIFLCGPELLSMGESVEIIKQVSGQNIDTTPSSKEEFLEFMTRQGAPVFVAEPVAEHFGGDGAPGKLYPQSMYGPASAATKKYSGKEPLRFSEYVEKHKAEWQDL